MNGDSKPTVQELAQLLSEEFERDGWGDIDSYLFKEVANPVQDSDHADDANALHDVLARVINRM